MRVLVVNSDSPNNRGDRAILAGNIALIRRQWPDADIWALSEYAERDAKWYGINFLPMSAYSTNPLHLLQLMQFARSCDYILWGGGELLKDYTNKIGILYWVGKMLAIRAVNPRLYGAFQGIGPTKAISSKKLIAFIANRTKAFIVRDHESKQKLESWGVHVPIISSFDPAVMTKPQPLDAATKQLLKEQFDISPEFLANSMGMGVRQWFHYKKGSWIPFKFRFWEKKKTHSHQHNEKLAAYTRHLARLCDQIIEEHNINLVFFPMHMLSSENDVAFSRQVIARMKHGERTRVIDQDALSPQQYLNVVGRCRVFAGARLHSSILATSALIPSIVFYYVDKGRLFFEQIGMQYFSHPIEDLLDEANIELFAAKIRELIEREHEIKQEIEIAIDRMRQQVGEDFARLEE